MELLKKGFRSHWDAIGDLHVELGGVAVRAGDLYDLGRLDSGSNIGPNATSFIQDFLSGS